MTNFRCSNPLLRPPAAYARAYLPGHHIRPFRLRHGPDVGGTSEVWYAGHLGAPQADPMTLKLTRADRSGASETLLDVGEHEDRPSLAMPRCTACRSMSGDTGMSAKSVWPSWCSWRRRSPGCTPAASFTAV